MTSPDDLTLLQWFVSGDATLEANQALRIEPANNLRQLLGHSGLLLATAYDTTRPPRIEVRRNTDYTDLLHQILLDYHFMPVGQGGDSQVLCYAHTPVPDGYHINYAEARQLWKQWWVSTSRRSNRHLQLNLFVLTQNQWYPIRDIAINSGTLYVETLRGETVHHGDDMMVWLEKDSVEESEKTRVWASSMTSGAPTTPTATVASVPPMATLGSTAPAQQVKVPIPATPPPCRPFAPQPATPMTPLPANSALASVVCTREGKIYVKTAVGVVVIEGNNLKAYGLAPRTTAASVQQRR